jgi:hypothetical protein
MGENSGQAARCLGRAHPRKSDKNWVHRQSPPPFFWSAQVCEASVKPTCAQRTQIQPLSSQTSQLTAAQGEQIPTQAHHPTWWAPKAPQGSKMMQGGRSPLSQDGSKAV